MTDPIKQIRNDLVRSAAEIAQAGHNGWGNACADGATAITELLARLDAAVWKTLEEHGPPEVGTECLVYSQQPWETKPSIKTDMWDELHEAPVSFSTITICVGVGWNDHADFYGVIAYMPFPTPPAIDAAMAQGVKL